MENQLNEAVSVSKIASNVSRYSWVATLWANGEIIPINKVIHIHNERTFDMNYGDQYMATLMIGNGFLTHDLIPNKDKLTISLERVSSDQLGAKSLSGTSDEFKYNCILANTENMLVSGGGAVEHRDSSNQNISEIELQLIEPVLEHTRTLEINGIFRRCTVQNVLEYFLGPTTGSIGIDLITPDNTTVYEQIIIPVGTKLHELVQYLQYTSGYGIYTSGAGCYLAKGIWYVWPLYDLTRYGKSNRAITISSLAPTLVPTIENTFYLSNRQVFILATGKVQVIDEIEHNQLQDGNGVRYMDADNILEGFGTTSNNLCVAKRSDNIVEYTKHSRRDGKNIAYFATGKTTANHFKEPSKVARREGQLISFVWENSLPDILNPGMPVKFSYPVNGVTKSVTGVLLRIMDNSQDAIGNYSGSSHVSNSNCTIFVNKIK